MINKIHNDEELQAEKETHATAGRRKETSDQC